MARPKTGMVLICPGCGKEFYKSICDTRRSETHTCSKKCMGEIRRGKERPPAVGKNISRAKKGRRLTEDHKKKLSDAKKGMTWPAEMVAKRAASTRKRYQNDPDLLTRVTEINQKRGKDPAFKEATSKHSKEMWRRPGHLDKFYDKISGENCHLWRGGISKREYCRKFNGLLKERVREAFDRKCYLCPTEEKDNGAKLIVHHCDFNKGQGCGHKWNLLPLCRKCHGRTNAHRHYYFNLLANYWGMNQNINFYAGDVIDIYTFSVERT